MMNPEFYMQLALDKAWEYQGLTYPNPAVGAVIVEEGRLVAIEAHQKAGSSHAEVLALLSAYECLSTKKIPFDKQDALNAHNFLLNLPQNFFSKCTLYVTLEPCAHHGKTPSCASLLKKLRLKQIFIGTKDPIQGHDKGAKILKNVSFPLLEEKCEALIEPFNIWQKRGCVVFKLAQTSNGKIGGGYLSSSDSLAHVHKLRASCTQLLIGGNTVRVDRPTLDCRFIAQPPPDVMIYTSDDNLDREIPLFHVPNRKIEVLNHFDFLQKPSFILVEGGEGMLNLLNTRIDYLLIYQTPKLSSHNLTYNTTMDLKILYQKQIERDLIVWSKQIDRE